MNDSGAPQTLEERLRSAAREFRYPPAPDVSARVRQRLRIEAEHPRKRLGTARMPAWTRRRRVSLAIAMVLALLIGLLAVPGVRAAVLDFFQIGAVRIYPVAPSATPTAAPFEGAPLRSATPAPTRQEATSTLLPSPEPSPTPLPSVLDLEGQTTLEQARKELPFPVRLPTYPPDLGPPDAVFVQRADKPLLVLVWMQPDHPGQVRMSLHEIPTDSVLIMKVQPKVIAETKVNGQQAFWTEGPYLLIMKSGDISQTRLVQGSTLVWVEGAMTYRLETGLSMEEAVKVAESLK